MKTCKGQNSVCKIKEQPLKNFSPVGCFRTRSICKECVNKLAQKDRDDKNEKSENKRLSGKKDVTVFNDPDKCEASMAMFNNPLV